MKSASVVVGMLLATAGFALACPEGGECANGRPLMKHEQTMSWVGDFGDRLTPTFRWSAGSPVAGVMFNAEPNGDGSHVKMSTVEVFVDDGGHVKVIRDGKEVPESRIGRSDDGGVVIFGDDGKAEKEVKISLGSNSDSPAAASVQKPPVMIGITMGDPDEALRAQLGLGDRKVIMIQRVIEGLPAANAGLKKYDIIVAIDGSDDEITPERLQEVLMGKRPGDELKLVVLRGGEKHSVEVPLAEYDAKALGMPMAEPSGVGDIAQGEEQLQAALEKLKASGLSDEQIAQFHDELKAAMEKAMAEKSRESGGAMGLAPRANQGGVWTVPGPRGEQMLELHVPQGLAEARIPEHYENALRQFMGGSDDLNRRLDELEERLDKMSERLDGRMEKLIDRIEKLTETLQQHFEQD